MFNSRFLFSARTVLFLIATSDNAVSSPVSGLFSDEGYIPYENNNGTISEFTMSSIRCAAECLADLSCNAIELCFTPSGQTCILNRGWKNTGGTLSQSTCRRFQKVSINLHLIWSGFFFFVKIGSSHQLGIFFFTSVIVLNSLRFIWN